MDKTAKDFEGFKMEAASEIGVDIKKEFNEQDDENQAVSVGGKMIKKMIERTVTSE